MSRPNNNTEFSFKKLQQYHQRKRSQKIRSARNVQQGLCVSCGKEKQNNSLQHCNYCRKKQRSRVLKSIHGITLEEYEKILTQQNGICWICNKREESKNGNLHVDHCHKTGKIRGLLCGKCNKGIGGFNDSVELLQQAIKYLQQFNK